MTALASVDYFSDGEVAQDPYDYFDTLRRHSPVLREPHHGVVVVTGHREVLDGFARTEPLPATNAVDGWRPPPTNEAMRMLSDRVIDEFVDNGRCEFLSEYATPFATLAAPDHAVTRDGVTRLLGSALRLLAERPEYQGLLRDDRGLVAPFVEETLRFDGPTKAVLRTTRQPTSIGDLDVPAGTVVMLCLAAANRDPRMFLDPNTFHLSRAGIGNHVAFGPQQQTCASAPLTRMAATVTLDRLLDRTRDIRIRERAHGAAHDRMYAYEPSCLMRGLLELHVEFIAKR